MPIKKVEMPHQMDYDAQPGINVDQMEKDSTAWRVTANDVQGPGLFLPLGARGGPYVGDPYSGTSGLGTERHMITYDNGGKGKSVRTGLK